DGTASRRDVEPHSLVNHGRRWYLAAWDRGRADWRTFRLDRMAKPSATGVRFARRALPARDAAAYVAQSITGAPNRYEAVLTLRARAEAIAARVPAHWGTLEPVDADSCHFRTGDDD